MKLFKILITPIDEFPSDPVLIMESEDIDELKRKAELLARELYNFSDYLWVFGENKKDYMELTIEDQYRFVIKT